MSEGPLLTPRQERFVQAYAPGDVTATEAAITAGYSQATAKQMAHKLRRNPKIRAALDEARREIMDELEIDPALPARTFAAEAESAEHSRDRLRGAELLGRWLGQIGPDVSITQNTAFVHQQAGIPVERLREIVYGSE